MSARSRSIALILRAARSRVGVAQDVEAFGVGLHQAVLDAVVDHLDEVAGAARARSAGSPARRADRGPSRPGVRGMSPRARRQRLEDRIEVLDDVLVAADHQAVAALEAPDAAAGAGVDVVDALAPPAPCAARECRP